MTARIVALLIAVVVACTPTTTSAAPTATVTISSGPVRLGVGVAHSAFPSITKSGNTLQLVWRQGSNHATARDGKIMRSQSVDGVHWSPAVVVRSGGDYRDPSISYVDGSQYLTWFTGSKTAPALGAVAAPGSSTPTRIDPRYGYAATTAPVVRLPNGQLGATWYGRKPGETVDTSWMSWSRDGGKSWTANRITNFIGAKVHTNEPYLTVDGQLTHMFYRWGTQDGIGIRTSTDSGRSGWGAPRKILAHASGRPTVLATSSGVLVMVYRQLPTKGARIAYSTDHGATWKDGGQLAGVPKGSPNGMTYASMVETTPGRVLVVLGMEFTDRSSVLYRATLTIGQQ